MKIETYLNIVTALGATFTVERWLSCELANAGGALVATARICRPAVGREARARAQAQPGRLRPRSSRHRTRSSHLASYTGGRRCACS